MPHQQRQRTTTTGSRVRSALALAGLRQVDAGEALGISQVQVSRRINDRTAFQPGELKKLADLCGVPLHTLITPAPRRATRRRAPQPASLIGGQ